MDYNNFDPISALEELQIQHRAQFKELRVELRASNEKVLQEYAELRKGQNDLQERQIRIEDSLHQVLDFLRQLYSAPFKDSTYSSIRGTPESSASSPSHTLSNMTPSLRVTSHKRSGETSWPTNADIYSQGVAAGALPQVTSALDTPKIETGMKVDMPNQNIAVAQSASPSVSSATTIASIRSTVTGHVRDGRDGATNTNLTHVSSATSPKAGLAASQLLMLTQAIASVNFADILPSSTGTAARQPIVLPDLHLANRREYGLETIRRRISSGHSIHHMIAYYGKDVTDSFVSCVSRAVEYYCAKLVFKSGIISLPQYDQKVKAALKDITSIVHNSNTDAFTDITKVWVAQTQQYIQSQQASQPMDIDEPKGAKPNAGLDFPKNFAKLAPEATTAAQTSSQAIDIDVQMYDAASTKDQIPVNATDTVPPTDIVTNKLRENARAQFQNVFRISNFKVRQNPDKYSKQDTIDDEKQDIAKYAMEALVFERSMGDVSIYNMMVDTKVAGLRELTVNDWVRYLHEILMPLISDPNESNPGEAGNRAQRNYQKRENSKESTVLGAPEDLQLIRNELKEELRKIVIYLHEDAIKHEKDDWILEPAFVGNAIEQLEDLIFSEADSRQCYIEQGNFAICQLKDLDGIRWIAFIRKYLPQLVAENDDSDLSELDEDEAIDARLHDQHDRTCFEQENNTVHVEQQGTITAETRLGNELQIHMYFGYLNDKGEFDDDELKQAARSLESKIFNEFRDDADSYNNRISCILAEGELPTDFEELTSAKEHGDEDDEADLDDNLEDYGDDGSYSSYPKEP